MNAAERYFENLEKLLSRIRETQREGLETAARRIAGAVRDGHLLYTFGTGHGHLLALEIFYRAGGLAPVCPMLDEKLMLYVSAAGSTLEERDGSWAERLLEKYPAGAGDVLIICSNSGRNAAPVMLAREARARGAYVIALTSLAHSSSVTGRNELGLRLFETADLVLDNGGIPGDAAVGFPDGTFAGPTSTAAGAAMLQAMICRVKEIALEEGFPADFYVSSNVDGGDEVNDRLIEKYAGRIPGLK